MRYGDLQGPFNKKKKKTPYLEVRSCEILKCISEKMCLNVELELEIDDRVQWRDVVNEVVKLQI
jgi:hypothetical protein